MENTGSTPESLTTASSVEGLNTSSYPTTSGPIYSPTDTDDWVRCPLYRKHKKSLTMRGGSWEYELTMGNALDAAMKYWWQRPGEVLTRDALALECGLTVIESAYQENPDYTLDQLKNLFKKGFKVALEGQPGYMGWRDLSQKYKLVKASGSERDPNGEGALRVNGYYAGTPDLICQELNQPHLAVIDLKTTMNLKPEWIPKRIRGYEYASQTYQYPWGVQHVYKMPVKEFVYQLVSFWPKAMNLIVPVEITPEKIGFWLSGAEQDWLTMGLYEGLAWAPPRLQSCDGKYGLCDFIRACWDCGNDPDKVSVYYERKGD